MSAVWISVFKGVSFMILWYSCIVFSVIYLYTPFTLLLFINRKWFRKCTDIILSCWEMYPAALLEILYGCRVCLSGDFIDPNESSILIMNHRNRLDWFFLWAALLHSSKPPSHRCKFVLKSEVRQIPGIGWGLQIAGFLYIKRNWDEDKLVLKSHLDYMKELENKYQILIFPEGTDFCPAAQAKSNSYAQKSGLPNYKYCLHPRTTGFTFLIDHMRKNSQIDAVYDLTIGYPKTLPHSELDIIQGKIPEEVHFKIKRYDIKDLPQTEEEITSWCVDKWAEKEKLLETFYTAKEDEKMFSPNPRCDEPWNAMYLAFFAWTGFTFFIIYAFFTNFYFFWYGIIATSSHILLSCFTNGIQEFEIKLFNKFDQAKDCINKAK